MRAPAADWAVRTLAAGDAALVDDYLARRGQTETLAALGWTARLERPEDWLTLVAVDAGSGIVGSVLATVHSGEALVHDLFVFKPRRDQGIAWALLTCLSEEAARCGVGELVADVADERGPAWRAFRAAGYEEIGPSGPTVPDHLRLRRRL